MSKGIIILMVIASIVFVVSILSIIIINLKNKINSLVYRIEISDSTITENLKTKLNLVMEAIKIIEEKLNIESKKFEVVKNNSKEEINNIKFDNILLDAEEEIIDIKEDYKELSKSKKLKEIIDKINDVNILLSGGKKFYNNYASNYNDLVKTFPYSLFAKKKTYKQLYIDNILNDNLEIDLEL